MNIEQAEKQLKKYKDDSESYHSEFDDILEARLMELDPKFMKTMQELYDKSGCSRWCA